MKTDLLISNILCLVGYHLSFYYLTPKLNELGSVIDLCQMLSYYAGVYNSLIINLRFGLVGFILSCFLCSFYAYIFKRTGMKDPSVAPFCFLVSFVFMCLDDSNFWNGMSELNTVGDMTIRMSVLSVVSSVIIMVFFSLRADVKFNQTLSLKILMISMLDLMIFFTFKDIGLAIVAGVAITLVIPKNITERIWGES
ncbi:hypothetical protein ACTG16_23610 [Aeromonas sp. 23P]|uniref:hypothetical protein n=1 Tax=Aeromonas sp. 23P TaxID=3452716 RepID=UPI003F793C88